MCQLLPLWPGREGHGPTRSTKAKLPQWRGEDPEPSLESSDFKVGVSKTKLKRLLSEFRNNSCPYTDGKSCWEEAVGVEKHHQKLSKNFQLLMRRRSSWKKNDLESLFDLAHTYGQAAKFHRPAFSRQRPKRFHGQSPIYLLVTATRLCASKRYLLLEALTSLREWLRLVLPSSCTCGAQKTSLLLTNR